MPVPHFFQSSEEMCGPACLRMLLVWHGITVDESATAAHCNVTSFGCAVDDLMQAAQFFGMNSAAIAIWDDVAGENLLLHDVPFIAMVDLAALTKTLPLFQFHYVVPWELRQDEVWFHDPADGPDRHEKKDDFLTAWATTGYRGVRLWTP